MKTAPNPVRDLNWYIVECARLSKLLDGARAEVTQLTNMLGQAQAGMEMADLIKRMVG